MKKSFDPRPILVAVMLFFVLLATVTFFVQARHRLSTDVENLEATQTALTDDLAQTEEQLTTMEAVAAARATESANLLAQVDNLSAQVPTYEADITSFQQEVATLTVDLAESQAEVGRLQTETATLHGIPPHIRIISPADGSIYEPGSQVPIIISASDAYGLAAVNVTINDDTLVSLSTQNDEPLVTVYQVWTPPADGEYAIGIMAVDIDGIASPMITTTINVVDIAQQNAEIRSAIETHVIEIRGLNPLRPIQPTLLTPEELRAELQTDLQGSMTPEEASQDVLVLNAFDFLPRDFDYLNFTLELYSEQVAGYYDPETRRFVVVSEDELLSVAEQLTHAHEFTHALQDQYFDLDALNDEELNGDAALAFRALAEGDASWVETLYALEYLAPEQLQALLAETAELDTAVLDSAPPVLANSLMFPYVEGLNFVQALYDEGGFEQVNEAWVSPPVSTEQILHPERYLAEDMPQEVTLESLLEPLGADWALLDQDVLGEFFLREYLGQQMDETTANAAAGGWDGDQYAVYWQAQQELMVMMLRVVWDSESEADEFAAAYNTFASQRYGATPTVTGTLVCWAGTVNGVSDTTCLLQNGAETFIVRAPNQAIAQAVVNLHYPTTPATN